MARAGTFRVEVTDRSAWHWYADSCLCSLPAGECRTHPCARSTQRPPAGDWRVWAYVAGRGAGKTRAGACWIQQRVESGTIKLGRARGWKRTHPKANPPVRVVLD